MRLITVRTHGKEEATEFAELLDSRGLSDKIWDTPRVVQWINRMRTTTCVTVWFTMGDVPRQYFISEAEPPDDAAGAERWEYREFVDTVLGYNEC